MEEVIDWHSIPRGSAFTFVGMPSDVDIVYYLGRSLVTPLIAILESESGAIYKKPLAVLRHWPEHDKRAQPAVDEAVEAVDKLLIHAKRNDDNKFHHWNRMEELAEIIRTALAQSTQSPVEQPPQTVAGPNTLIVRPCKYRDMTQPDNPEKDGWEFIANANGKELHGCGNDYLAVVELAADGISALQALTRHEGA